MERSHGDHTMRIGLFYPHTATPHIHSETVAERVPDVLDVDVHRRLIHACEAGGLDFAFSYDTTWSALPLSDGAVSSRGSALMSPLLMTALAAMSRRIGLVSTMHVGLLHPVVVARIGANLDALSNGRWALNIVAGAGGSGELVSDGIDQGDHDERYARASEAMEIVTRLWSGDVIDLGRLLPRQGRTGRAAARATPTPGPGQRWRLAGGDSAGREVGGLALHPGPDGSGGRPRAD